LLVTEKRFSSVNVHVRDRVDASNGVLLCGRLPFCSIATWQDEDNVADIDLNQKGRIRAAALAALLWPAPGTSRRDYTRPLPDCLLSSIPIALAAQVPDENKQVRRCLETARYLEAEAKKVAGWVKIAPFGALDIRPLADWIWSRSEHTMGQATSISVTVWDHASMDAVVNAVLNTSGAPKWPGDRYDVLWLLDLSKGELWQYPHELLYGDTADKPEMIWKPP